ncbi:hypothetical protein PHMEG_0009812 [Phytophthora megakarya]|uniref:ZSWIM1/3 RNaseH-like domain-containing protein n=1 Tax=Phytophthora megakarya TaxID=4795 RepID=A0A225WG61_9STRA|nr:hypothetical protein PHMEG_0009812 [Phytophthora megakarya]
MDTSDSETEDLRVTASRFETWHDNWDAFFTCFKTYQKRTSKLYCFRKSVKATARNQVIKCIKSWSKNVLIPEAFGDYYKKFVCTHDWEKSHKWKGVRTGHQKSSTGCAAVLCATVSFCSEAGAFRVCVTQHRRTHNHHLKKKILKYLQETSGKRITLRDVHNLVQRLKSPKQTQTIVWQTRQMRRFVEAFPKVVMLDSTHGTNASKYRPFSFMIDDVFGHGQYVQHALVVNESHGCMKDAIDVFKENNSSWDWIRAIMIDKDFGEISLLKKEFPLARVLICHFHLKKYLGTEMSKAINGGHDAVDVDRIEDAVDMMVKSQDEKEYDKGLRYIISWMDKNILRPEMELDECVETLIFLRSTAELEYASQFHVIGSRHYQVCGVGKLSCIQPRPPRV